MEFRPSSTVWVAMFSSSSKIQAPCFIAWISTPSAHEKAELFDDGTSEPSKSIMSVCSLRFTL